MLKKLIGISKNVLKESKDYKVRQVEILIEGDKFKTLKSKN